MKLLPLNASDQDRYNELAIQYATIFNTTAWTKIFGENIQHYGIYHDNNSLIGGFSLHHISKFRMTIHRNPPFTPCIGPFLKIEARNATTIMDTWKEALSLMAEFLDSMSYSIMAYSLNFHVNDLQPFIWKKFKVIPGYTYLIDLTLPSDELWNRLSKVRKNELKKTVADGLVVRKTDDLECIRTLVLKTFSRQDKEVDRDVLKRILYDFAREDNSYAFVTYKGEIPIAGTMCIHSNTIAHALMGGYDPEQRHRGAGALADWECIKHAKGLGLKTFDFEGSMLQPVEKYMRGFGGRLTPYFTINKGNILCEILLKFIRRERF